MATRCAGSKHAWRSDVPWGTHPCWFIGFFCGPPSLPPGMAGWLALGPCCCWRGIWDTARHGAGCPAARASWGSPQPLSALVAASSSFPLSAATIRLRSGNRARAVFQHEGVPVSFYFSCRRTDFWGDFGVWDFLFVFKWWAFSVFSPQWFLDMRVLQMFLSLSEVK